MYPFSLAQGVSTRFVTRSRAFTPAAAHIAGKGCTMCPPASVADSRKRLPSKTGAPGANVAQRFVPGSLFNPFTDYQSCHCMR